MRSGKTHAGLIGLLVVGCNDPAQQPDPQPFVVVSSDVWSGTSLTIKSAGFVDADPSAVLLDQDSLLFSRVDDSTLHVSLPDAPGTHHLRVVSNLVLSTPVPVKLNGFLSAEAGPVFMGRAVRGAYPTEVYASGPTGLRRWNVSTGATFDYPDSMHAETCSRGIGIGPHAGELLLNGGCSAGRWQVWRVEPTLQRLDTTQWYSDRFVDQSASLFVLPGSHWTSLIECETACTFRYTRTESAFDVVYSPGRDRAVVLTYVVSDTGVAIIDVATGAASFYIPMLESAAGAVFSDAGDTLYLTGQDSLGTGGSARLMAIRASDGEVLRMNTLPFGAWALALDPIRPLLYAAGFVRGTGQPVLGVFDRVTLEPIALLHADQSAFAYPAMILPSPLERRIYVITSFDGGFDVRIHAPLARFETPPY